MTAPAPSPSSANRMVWFTAAQVGTGEAVAGGRSAGRDPSLRRTDPVTRLRHRLAAAVPRVELGVVVAHSRSLGYLPHVITGDPSASGPLKPRAWSVIAFGVRLSAPAPFIHFASVRIWPKPDVHPRITDQLVLALALEDLLVRRDAGIGHIERLRRRDRVDPFGEVAEALDGRSASGRSGWPTPSRPGCRAAGSPARTSRSRSG